MLQAGDCKNRREVLYRKNDHRHDKVFCGRCEKIERVRCSWKAATGQIAKSKDPFRRINCRCNNRLDEEWPTLIHAKEGWEWMTTFVPRLQLRSLQCNRVLYFIKTQINFGSSIAQVRSRQENCVQSKARKKGRNRLLVLQKSLLYSCWLEARLFVWLSPIHTRLYWIESRSAQSEHRRGYTILCAFVSGTLNWRK